MDVKTFYKGMRIPTNLNGKEFINFFSKIGGIMSTFMSKGDMINFRVKVEDSESAYIDFQRKIIALPKWYLNEDSLKNIAPDSDDLILTSISLMNGSAAHESLHGKWTKIDGDYETWLQKFFNKEIKKFGEDFVAAIINICEDIYIESRENPFEVFTIAKNNILFNKFIVDSNIVDIIVQFKNKNLRSKLQEVLDVEQFNILQSFVELPNKVGASFRVDNFRKAIEIFGEQNSKDSENGKGFGSDDCDECGDPKLGGSKVDGEGAKNARKSYQSSPNKSSTDDVSEDIEDDIKSEISKSLIDKKSRDNFRLPETIHADIEELVDEVGFLEDECLDSTFVQILRNVRHKNTTHGQPMTRGSKINSGNLYRIGTDQKVFSNPEIYDAKAEEIEVGILIDSSGSMSAYSLFERVVSTTYCISKDMIKTRIPHFIKAHTSVEVDDISRFDVPLLVDVSKFQINGTTSNTKEKFEKLLMLNLQENYDGFMIEESLKGFSKKESKKILFVLSDGKPLAPFYSGDVAVNHTKQKINDARRKGYVIISISLVKRVVEANDNIYGKDWNIDASKDLKQQLQKILVKISKKN